MLGGQTNPGTTAGSCTVTVIVTSGTGAHVGWVQGAPSIRVFCEWVGGQKAETRKKQIPRFAEKRIARDDRQ
jgi:hypothetical protein